MNFLLCFRKILWLNICFVVILSKPRLTYSYLPYPVSEPPEIWLSSYQESDTFTNTIAEPEFRSVDQFQNIYISKFNKTDYVITEDTNMVFFTCQAKYPVKWSFPHMKQIENLRFYLFETSTSRSSNFDKTGNSEPTTKTYQTVIRIQLDYLADIFSANLTCGVAGAKVRLAAFQSRSDHFSSIYLFYAGKHVIENQGSTIQIQAAISNKIVLPCRPATPTVLMLLEKLTEGPSNPKTKWKRLEYPTQYLHFDPKIGFILNMDSRQDMNIFGLYKCTAFDEAEDINEIYNSQVDDDSMQRPFIYVNVTFTNDPKIDTESIQFHPTVDLKGDATIAYNREVLGKHNNITPNEPFEESKLLCCSGVQNLAPSIYSDSCVGYLQCQVLKWSMTAKLQGNLSMDSDIYLSHGTDIPEDHSDCCQTFFMHGQIIFCRGENVYFADQFVAVFDEVLVTVSNRSYGSSTEPLFLSVYEPERRKFEVSRKIFLMIGCPITSNQHYQLGGGGYIQLGRFDGYNDIEYDYAEDGLLIDVKQRDLMKRRIVEYPRDHFYVGEILVPICLGWTHFYSYGAYIGINFKNGSRMIINLKKESFVTDVYFSGDLKTNIFFDDQKQFVHKVGRQITATKDIVSVECWMPQWDSKTWDRITRNLSILEAVAPTFVDNGLEAEEIVYFDLDEEDTKLVWTVKSGVPEANIYVRKDGKKVLKRLASLQNHFHSDKLKGSFESLFNVTVEQDDENRTVVMIRFVGKISHEMQGVYQCTVENVGGSMRRSFRVIIKGKGNLLVYVLFATVIVLSLLLIGLGLRHRRQIKQVIFLRSNHT